MYRKILTLALALQVGHLFGGSALARGEPTPNLPTLDHGAISQPRFEATEALPQFLPPARTRTASLTCPQMWTYRLTQGAQMVCDISQWLGYSSADDDLLAPAMPLSPTPQEAAPVPMAEAPQPVPATPGGLFGLAAPTRIQ